MISKEDLVGFENDWAFIEEESINVYKFSEDGLGVLYTDDKEINFKWKINSKGFINITYNGILFYLKLESENKDYYVFSYYKKNDNNKIIKIKNITLLRKDLNKIEKQKNIFESPKYKEIYDNLKNDNLMLIIFSIILLFSFVFFITTINFIPLLSGIKFTFKLIISLIFSLYLNKKIFIISKIINEKYGNKIKKLLF